MGERELITAKEAARLVGIDPSRITRLVQAGVLQAYNVPLDRRSVYVDKAQVQELAQPRPGLPPGSARRPRLKAAS